MGDLANSIIASLHHPVFCHLQDPSIHPRVVIVAPLGPSNQRTLDSQLALSIFLSDCELVTINGAV